MTELAKSGVFNSLESIMRSFFDEYQGPITPDTTAEDVPQWDSLAHVQLLVMIEQSLGVRFTTSEISQLQKFGDLVALVEQKLG